MTPPTRHISRLRSSTIGRLVFGTALVCALLGCVSQRSGASAKEGKSEPGTYTGRIDIMVHLGLRGQSGEPLYSVLVLLDTPTADGWHKVEADVYSKSELRVGQSYLRSGDRISFAGYVDELFKPYHRARMAVLKNIRIIEHAPTPEPQPGPAAKPAGAERVKDGSKEPWAPPPGFGPPPDKAKSAESLH